MKELNLVQIRTSETNSENIQDIIENFIIMNETSLKFFVGDIDSVNYKLKDIIEQKLKTHDRQFHSPFDEQQIIIVN